MMRNASHSRIIWSCSWSPDDVLFVTGSRDKSIHVWQTTDSGPEKIIGHIFPESVTAVAFAPVVRNHRWGFMFFS